MRLPLSLLLVFMAAKLDIGKLNRIETEHPPIEIHWDSLCMAPDFWRVGVCDNHYYVCANFKKILAKCPDGLVYDERHKMCNYKEDKMGCPEFKYDIWLYRSKNETEKNSLCERKPDGKYSFRCENEHYECVNGTVIWRKCPDGLVYNRNSHLEDKCTKKEHNEECEQFDEMNPKYGNISSASGSPVITQEVATENEEFSCFNKRNGLYRAGRCQNHYYTCLNFKPFLTTCPYGLVFSLGKCQYKRDAKECPEYKTDLELLYSANETERNSICETKADMPMTFPCENIFIQCHKGVAHFHNCPPGEVYTQDPQCKMDRLPPCTRKELNNKCPEFDAGQCEPILKDYVSDNTCEWRDYVRLGDCMNEYYICKDKKPSKAFCPDNLVFTKNNRCEYNSIFSCENEYYECKNGQPIWKSCPAGQVYNQWTDWMHPTCVIGCVDKIHARECPEFEEEHPKCSIVDPVELAKYNPDEGLRSANEIWVPKVNYKSN